MRDILVGKFVSLEKKSGRLMKTVEIIAVVVIGLLMMAPLVLTLVMLFSRRLE